MTKPVVESISKVSFVAGFVHLIFSSEELLSIPTDWCPWPIPRTKGSVVAKGARNKLPSGPNRGLIESELHVLRSGVITAEELGARFLRSGDCSLIFLSLGSCWGEPDLTRDQRSNGDPGRKRELRSQRMLSCVVARSPTSSLCRVPVADVDLEPGFLDRLLLGESSLEVFLEISSRVSLIRFGRKWYFLKNS